jgi:hypothetical protein
LEEYNRHLLRKRYIIERLELFPSPWAAIVCRSAAHWRDVDCTLEQVLLRKGDYASDDRLDQLGEAHSRRLGRSGGDARLGEAGDRVDLEHLRGLVLVED